MRMKSMIVGVPAVLVVVGLVLVNYAPRYAFKGEERFLELDVKSSVSTPVMVYHETHHPDEKLPSSSRFTVSPSSVPVTYKVPLPERNIRFIRVDPLNAVGAMAITGIRVTAARGIIREVAMHELESVNSLANIQIAEGECRIVRQSREDHPALYLKIQYPINPQLNPNRVKGVDVLLLLSAMVGIALFGVAFAVHRIRKASGEGTDTVGTVAFWTVTAFLIVAGAKWTLMLFHSVNIPWADAWDGEAWSTLIPYFSGNLAWSDLFAAHNEHRIFFTRVLSLGLVLISGHWDQWIQQVVSALLHTTAGIGLMLLFWNAAGRKRIEYFALLTVLMFALPFSYRNVLMSFQSQFYFLIAFTLLSIWLCSFKRPFSAGWFAGAAFLFCNIFTVASGFLAPLIIGVLMLLKMYRRPGRWKEAIPTLALCVAVILFSQPFLVEGQHQAYKADTFMQFLSTFGKTLAWPFTELPWMAVLLWAPFFIVAIQYVLKRSDEKPYVKELLLGVGGWILAQALAAGIYRGGYGGGPPSRHMDLTSIGIMVNGVALWVLCEQYRRHERWGGRLQLYLGVWWLALIIGVTALSADMLLRRGNWYLGAAAFRDQAEEHREIYEQFYRDDSIDYLYGVYQSALPVVNPLVTSTYLRNDVISSRMPPPARKPVYIEQRQAEGSAFQQGSLLPTTPTLPGSQEWGTGAKVNRGIFTSIWMTNVHSAYLQFEVAGHLYMDENKLELYNPVSGKRHAARKNNLKTSDALWASVSVKNPGPPTVLVVEDQCREFVAFRAPREVTAVTYWTEQFLKLAPWILGVGLSMPLIAIYRWRQQSDTCQ